MKQFDRFFDLFEKGSRAVPARRHYPGNLELSADEAGLSFIQDTSAKGPRRFISWFRWVLLALSIAFSLQVYRSFAAVADHWIVAAVSWGLIAVALAVGIGGAFVACPVVARGFRRLETLAQKNQPLLPSFDLVNRTVHPPGSQPGYPFDAIAGLKSADDVEGWKKLVMLTKDDRVVFLVNYPASRSKKIAGMLDRISKLTSIKLLE